MIVPDVNLLLYAHDSSSPFHSKAARWWTSCLSGRVPIGLCDVVLFAFVRISTNRRVFRQPMAIDEASEHVRLWLGRSVTEHLSTDASDVHRALDLLQEQGVGSKLTTDAQIAAIASRYRATIHTADTDFHRFPGLRWKNPLLDH